MREHQLLAVRIGDVPLTIRGLPPDLSARLADLLRPFVSDALTLHEAASALQIQVERVAEDSSAPGRQILRNSGQCHTFFDVDELVKCLEWAAVTDALAETERYAVFHGALLTRGAATVMLLGASGNGKTTLTLGLIERGWEPLADDLALITPATGGALAFPRCFHLDEFAASVPSDPARLTWPGELDGYARPVRWGASGQRPTAIFLLTRCATCPPSRSPITQAWAAGALLAQALRTRLAPARIAQIAAQVAGGAACYTLRNGALEGTLNLIESAAREPVATSPD
jgi:hypothetical protein